MGSGSQGFRYDLTTGDEEPNEKLKAEAIQLIRNGLGKAELENIGGYAFPVYWILRNNQHQLTTKNGTMFLLDTGCRIIGVTAAHVVIDCFDDTRKPTYLGCMIGVDGKPPLVVYLGDRIIDANKE